MIAPYIERMKQIFPPVAALTLCAAPAFAEDTQDNGLSLMEEGAKLFFQGIMQEMEPAMDDLKSLADTMEPAMRQFVREMGPALADVLKKVDDLTLYHPPEMLPNGDIIMRRKEAQEPPVSVPANPEIEL
ncbi:MAG: hypothetical protein ACRBBS_11250 [Thalassovita sp.]